VTNPASYAPGTGLRPPSWRRRSLLSKAASAYFRFQARTVPLVRWFLSWPSRHALAWAHPGPGWNTIQALETWLPATLAGGVTKKRAPRTLKDGKQTVNDRRFRLAFVGRRRAAGCQVDHSGYRGS